MAPSAVRLLKNWIDFLDEVHGGRAQAGREKEKCGNLHSLDRILSNLTFHRQLVIELIPI
jgi:hypothetical protein